MILVTAGWTAYDVYADLLATAVITVGPVDIPDVTSPMDWVNDPSTAAYQMLLANAQANPLVANYVNPIPPSVLDPSIIQGYAIPHLEFWADEILGP